MSDNEDELTAIQRRRRLTEGTDEKSRFRWEIKRSVGAKDCLALSLAFGKWERQFEFGIGNLKPKWGTLLKDATKEKPRLINQSFAIGNCVTEEKVNGSKLRELKRMNSI
ncbi:hypothetical protein niasHT_000236 [Heterodera trifolii]|uniref:Uncharacterized protein n=1 Tax=Heterodera trifolii TaxID=157864 RepID=A0ABD2LWS6_9BILA